MEPESNGTRSALSYLSEFMPHPQRSLVFSNVSDLDVSKLLAELQLNKATGLDNFQSKLLKIASPAISNSLAYIFNKSLQTGSIPDEWKSARVSAIFKKGTRTDPGNYRPISILPIVSKLLEKIVHSQLYKFCSENQILCLEQSGFRPKHSTQTSLHKLTETIHDELHKKKVVGLVALDLKKAFDTVDHSILLSKLEHYGISGTGLHWFRSYLTGRNQRACINGNLSDSLEIHTGVPQDQYWVCCSSFFI